MRKRIIAVLLSTLIGVGSITSNYSSASAASKYDTYYEEYAASITDRCVEFQGYLENIGSKQFGLLYSLRMLTQYSEYVYFMSYYLKQFDDVFEAKGRAISGFEEDLASEFSAFNQRFGTDGTGFDKLHIDYKFTGVAKVGSDVGSHAQARSDIKDFLVDTVPKYLNSQLKSVKDKLTECNGDHAKEEKVKAQYTTLLVNVYNIYSAMLDAEDDLQNLSPFDEKTGNHLVFGIKKGKTSMRASLKSAISGFEDLMEIAQKALAAEQTDEEITVDLTKHYIDNLSDAISTSSGVEIPESPKLSRLYYAIMSASSVYVPMQSYAGNSEFQAALKSLTNDDQEQLELVEFYSSVKDIRKPLYKRELDDKGYPTGTAKIVTIQDYIDDIKKGNSGSLCSVLGQFRFSSTSNSWLYYQDTNRTSVEDNVDGAKSNQDTEVNTSDDDLGSFTEGEDVETDDFDPDEDLDGGNLGDGDDSGNDDDGEENPDNTESSINKPWWEEPVALLGSLFSFTKVAKAASPEPSGAATPEPSGAATPEPSSTLEPATNNSSAGSEEGTADDGEVSGMQNDSASEGEGVIDDNAVYAYGEITDETKLTEPQFFYGCDYSRDVDNMTYCIMKNILKTCANINYISDKTTRYIYINAFGDIVTDDNLIIFPGIANPLLYRDTERYNPYTAAFMNTYPTVYKSTGKFKLTNKNSIGKYIVAKQTSSDSRGKEEIFGMETQSISTVKTTAPLTFRDVFTEFTVDGTAKYDLLEYRKLKFTTETAAMSEKENNNAPIYNPLVTADQAEIGGVMVFPYVVSEDKGFEVAKGIAQNMYWFLTTDDVTGKDHKVNRFNENYVLHNFIISGVYGTNNPKGYSTNQLDQYNKYVENASSRFLSKLSGLSETVINAVTKIQGVIGLRDALQNPLLSRVLVFCRYYFYFYLLIVAIVLLIAFARMRLDMFQGVVKLILSLVVAYLAITIIPAMLPGAFNLLLNNPTENLSYKIMATQIEKNMLGDGDVELNEDGSIKMNADSLTLYRAGAIGFNDFLSDLNVEPSEVSGGEIVRLDDEAGFYAEGDKLKINTDRLYSSLKIMKDDSVEVKETETKNETNGEGTITGSENKTETEKSSLNVGATNTVKLKAYKTVSNNVDYYAPFYQIVDSFIENMDKFQEIAQVPRTTITYSNGLIKDNFLVYSFVNSRVFLTPGVYEAEYDAKGVTTETEEEIAKTSAEFAAELEAAFGESNTASDFLGLSTWLASPTKEMHNTLWYKTMVKNGYYNEETGEANEKRMNRLIEKVNNVTRDFIYDCDDIIGQISDDTMIKLISTRALVALCQEVSEFNHWVYPFSLNYGDYSLKEVINSVFISNYEKYIIMNLNVVDYVGQTSGWFNLIILDIVVVLLFLITWIVQNLVPVMYLLLCCLVIFKLLAQGDSKLPVKGFLKCSLVIMISYTVLAIGLVASAKLDGSFIGLYLMLLICILVGYLLSVVITSLIHNFADLGNGEIGARITNGLKLEGIRNRISNLHVGNLRVRSSHSNNNYRDRRIRDDYRDSYNSYDQYRYDSSVEDAYGGWGYGYGRSPLTYGSADDSTTDSDSNAYEDVDTFDEVSAGNYEDVDDFSTSEDYQREESERTEENQERETF